MSIDRTDPRLTAYALGEMDERQCREFETQLDDAARAEIEAIRALAGDLRRELADECAPALTPAQRARITRRPRRWIWPVAALLMVALGVQIYSVAMQEPEMIVDAYSTKSSVEPATEAAERTIAAPAEESISLGRFPKKKEAAETISSYAERYEADQGSKQAVIDQRNASVLRLRESVAVETDRIDGSATHVREGYDRIDENPFHRTGEKHTSTFSIDVDTASYSNMRRFLVSGRLPPKDAIRVEELINYFRYDYAPPAEGAFATHVELAGCPWNSRHLLARIALKGREVVREKRPASNLVFLIDVSGSMQSSDKLQLLVRGLDLLVNELDERDRVSIVVYAGAAGCVLRPTEGTEKAAIRGALSGLRAGGSTNGGQGIQLAYALARENFIKGGVNRVLLCTDGDFNVGITDRGSLTRLIEKEAKSGVFLSVLGFGTGNYQDAAMEALSNRGNGNYAYVDSLREARKVLVEQMSGTLVTIAKDVKIQIFFNPAKIAGWRLIGYENRVLAARDFNDDKKDAGEIGAGHTVTALYELVPAGVEIPGAKVDPNPFVKPEEVTNDDALFQLRLRSKKPDSDRSTLIERDITGRGGSFDAASGEFRWAAGVAAFGMLLRESPYIEGVNLGAVEEICAGAKGEDAGGYRAEFLELVHRARNLR
ncbi:MAG: YfbK domain-containing protein [Planctomycetota bacterium]|jgi:Ca-activated chloride channel family protein